MSSYLLKYKGTYKLRVPYDLRKKTFSRKPNGTLEDIDMYIECNYGNMIFHDEKSTLLAYVPSLKRGNRIIKEASELLGKNCMSDIQTTDSEVLFKFNANNIDTFAKLLKAKTRGANTSPFSVKNLPKDKEYKIPTNDLERYKSIVADVPKEKALTIAHMTKMFIKNLATKKTPEEKIKAHMREVGLSGKEYIHSLGEETWQKYLEYMEENIGEGKN